MVSSSRSVSRRIYFHEEILNKRIIALSVSYYLNSHSGYSFSRNSEIAVPMFVPHPHVIDCAWGPVLPTVT